MRYGRPSCRASARPRSITPIDSVSRPDSLQCPDERTDRLQHQRTVVECFRVGQHLARDAFVRIQVARNRAEVAHLVRGEQRASRTHPRLRTAPARRVTSDDRGIGVAFAPREEAREMDLHRREPHPVVGGLAPAARSYAWRWIATDETARRADVRPPIPPASPSPSNTSSQRRSPCGNISRSADSSPIDSRWCSRSSAWRSAPQRASTASGSPRSGRAHEVLRGLPEPTRLHQRARRVAVQGAAPGRTDARVDRLLVERVGDLVAHVAAEVFLVHESQPYELAQRVAERVEVTVGDVLEIGQLDAVSEHRDELERRALRGPERLQRGRRLGPRDPRAVIGGADRRDRRLRRRATRNRPIANSGLPCDRSMSQSTSGGPIAAGSMNRRASRPTSSRSSGSTTGTAQDTLLLEREQHLAADDALAELHRSGREHDQDALVGEVAGEVVERLPRRAVGEVHVVEHDDEGLDLREPGEQVRKRCELADQRRCGAPTRRAGGGHARQERGEIVDGRAAQLADLVRVERAEVLFQRFDPETQ